MKDTFRQLPEAKWVSAKALGFRWIGQLKQEQVRGSTPLTYSGGEARCADPTIMSRHVTNANLSLSNRSGRRVGISWHRPVQPPGDGDGLLPCLLHIVHLSEARVRHSQTRFVLRSHG